MDDFTIIAGMGKALGDAISISEDLDVSVTDPAQVRNNIEQLVRTAAVGDGRDKSIAQWLIRQCAQEMGIFPASIHDLSGSRPRRGEGRFHRPSHESEISSLQRCESCIPSRA